MHITFPGSPSSNVDKVTCGYQPAAAETQKAASGYALDISGKVTDDTAYGFLGSCNVQGRTAEEVMQAAEYEDIDLYRDYMTVMSNSMSDEDFHKLLEKGYHPSDMDLTTAVTIVDAIKAELVKAGVNITGYTDTLDAEELEEITGSASFAESLLKAFARENLPVTEENVRWSTRAYEQGMKLTELSDGAIKYLIQNELDPEIDNLYIAGHVGAEDAHRQGRGYFAEELPGYYGHKAADTDITELREQIEKVIERAGLPVNEQTVQDGFWLVEKGLPLTPDNLVRYEELKKVKLPPTEDMLTEAIAGTLVKGIPPTLANMSERRSVPRRAAECLADYEEKYRESLLAEATPENIKARKMLEEIRLRMTVEANIRLLKSGFSIETASMEKTIEALRALEEQTETLPPEKISADLCLTTMRKTREIPYLPAAALGRILSEGQPLTVNNVYETGKSMQESFRKAGEVYETMMTAPRADLGDSIKKAFRNVDELLASMGQEPTEENRKAVRSIAYNHMELTEENLLAVKGADRVVQRVVEKMTPPAVLAMIRDGINPLKTSMEELDEYLTGRADFTEESEKYSRFLYRLEKSRNITKEEKDSFIGIYRLLRQLEKSDGAAVGKLVDGRAELTFANLLSAVRTGRLKGVNVSVAGDFGGLAEAVEKGISIDAQIDAAYGKKQLSDIRALNEVDDDFIEMLEEMEQPVTIDNLLAAEAVYEYGDKPFKKLAELQRKRNAAVRSEEAAAKEPGALSDAEEIFADRETFEAAYKEMIAQNIAYAEEQASGEGIRSVDVREMQLTCKQLHILGQMAKNDEEYVLPETIDGRLMVINLKLEHKADIHGKVYVDMYHPKLKVLAGKIFLEDGSVRGYFIGEGKETLAVLTQAAERFKGRVENAGLQVGDICVTENGGDEWMFGLRGVETKQLYKVAGMVIGAMKESLMAYADRSRYEN